MMIYGVFSLVYLSQVVISVGSFVFSIITHEPFDDLHPILIGELERTTENVFSLWFKSLS